MNQDFHRLPDNSVMVAFRNAKHRVLLFDNEGTLATDQRKIYRDHAAAEKDVEGLKSRGSAPSQEVLDCLSALSQDPRTTVIILSGRDKATLTSWFGGVKNLGLAAERGFYYKMPAGDWKCMKLDADDTWRSYAFEIMRQFDKRTQGSFVENKGSALVWQYRDADQHFGSWQAKELSFHLKDLLFNFDVDIIDGSGYVE